MPASDSDGRPPALPAGFVNPPNAYSLAPFWFWNDVLDAGEIVRQIDDFADHGIFGFVIHPRVGLPEDCGWMSPKLLEMMRVAIEHAASREMQVILYDEGMYPSGSASGQVVEEDPLYACRGLVKHEGELDDLPEGHHRVAVCARANGEVVTIVDQPIDSWIRGLHYTGDDNRRSPNGWAVRDTPEARPPAGDLLNPDAMACFIRRSYQQFYDEFAEHFGKTITAVFTDEPMVLGRGNLFDARPGTTGILEHVNAYLGYDFTPHLPALWHDDEPDAATHRANYKRAIHHRLGETYYAQLHDWCEAHNVALTGHPEGPEDIGHLRFFQWPGQDVIWNEIAPGEAAVTGGQSTQAKCAASAKLHLGRSRNANEFMGAYGEDVSLSLYHFVAGWLLVRGCDLLIPHAYFYSVRGPRIDECPPQLGPHGEWWGSAELKQFHAACQRLCWLNASARPVVHVAIVCSSHQLPIVPARALYESQIDFHYLDEAHLAEDAVIAADGIRIGQMHYAAVLGVAGQLSGDATEKLGHLSPDRCWLLEDEGDGAFLEPLRAAIPPGVTVDTAQPWLRLRRLHVDGRDWLMAFNEGLEPISARLQVPGGRRLVAVDPASGEMSSAVDDVTLQPSELSLFLLSS